MSLDLGVEVPLAGGPAWLVPGPRGQRLLACMVFSASYGDYTVAVYDAKQLKDAGTISWMAEPLFVVGWDGEIEVKDCTALGSVREVPVELVDDYRAVVARAVERRAAAERFAALPVGSFEAQVLLLDAAP